MTTFMIHPDPLGGVNVQFRYDPGAVDLIKSIVPSSARSWNPDLKVWHVADPYGDILIVAVRRLGYEVRDFRPPRRATPPPPPPRTSRAPAGADAWAVAVLRAVGPTRSEAVFKALSRVLHPDVATGDTQLMQHLNNARTQIGTSA